MKIFILFTHSQASQKDQNNQCCHYFIHVVDIFKCYLQFRKLMKKNEEWCGLLVLLKEKSNKRPIKIQVFMYNSYHSVPD